MNGWVKLHRPLLEWQWASSPNHMSLFVTLLLRANYKPSSWRGIEVSPGQVITGREQLATWTGLTVRQVRTCLKDLVTTGEVTIKPTTKYSIITITNWIKYQQDDQQLDQQTTNKRPADDQQTTTSKKVKKEKKGKSKLEGNLAAEILIAFNTICSRSFQNSKSSLSPIVARLSEGFTMEEFQTVIRHKHEQWANDHKMSAFLRPETIFGNKFDSYLQDAKASLKPKENAIEAFFSSQGIQPDYEQGKTNS